MRYMKRKKIQKTFCCPVIIFVSHYLRRSTLTFLISVERVFRLDIFETPVTVTPQQEISKTFKLFKNSLKILNIDFWGKSVYFWGKSVYFWGKERLLLGEITFTFGEIRDSRRLLGLWNFFLGGFVGSVGRWPVGVFFEEYLNFETQIWRVAGKESGCPELLGRPRTSPDPNFSGSFSATSPEVLSLWNLTAIQRFPGSFPNFPGSSPNFPGSSGTSLESAPFSGKPDTLS